jgi:hypothetical protein
MVLKYSKGQKLNSFYLKQLNPREEKTQINFYHLAKMPVYFQAVNSSSDAFRLKEMFN